MKRKRILFVCTGNTCRSPMAEMILRAAIRGRKIRWWDVSSCGVHAEKGAYMHPDAVLALGEAGIPISAKFAPRQLSQKLIEGSTLVVTMTQAHRQMLEDCGNVVCISRFCGHDVPDPYGAGIDAYRLTRDVLITACESIIDNYILKYEE